MIVKRTGVASVAHFFVGLLLVFSATDVLANRNEEAEAKKVVETFLRAEFEGRQDQRTNGVGLVYRGDTKPDINFVLFFEHDEVVIVSDYVISRIEVRGASIRARILATAVGKTKRISASKIGVTKWAPARKDEFSVDLRKVKGSWRIVNPPLPRIAKLALVRYFESDVAGFNEIEAMGKLTTNQAAIRSHRQMVLQEILALRG